MSVMMVRKGKGGEITGCLARVRVASVYYIILN